MTILETERLRLRRMTCDDAAFLHELMNEPEFIRNVADRGITTLADAVRWIEEKILPGYGRPSFGFHVVELRGTGVSIGFCGLIKRETLDDVDIGYSILQRHSGSGYAYEAASAMMAHGRNVLGLQRIVGLTAPSNAISIRPGQGRIQAPLRRSPKRLRRG
ncbi:MAG: GNAT family N-acetyltransferase [Verrucomicrobiota bacterium]